MSLEKKAAVVKYHKRTLLETADRLLTEYGYTGMNMNLLAKEAGYSKATVYVYMHSKDEILRLLSIRRLELMRGELGLIIKNDMTKSEKLEQVKTLLDEFVREDGVYFDFVCTRRFEPDYTDADGDEDSGARLSELLHGIISDLTAVAPEQELKQKWYEYYGRLKTARMFEA